MADRTQRNRGLGRGLSALMADVTPDPVNDEAEKTEPRRGDQLIPIEKINPNPDQPRRHFTDEDLQDLTASVREKGIIQPLILRPDPNGDGYQIVAGERRWRAAQRAQLHELPAIIREFNDTEALEVAIIENIQRADLNAIEEAQGYSDLMERFGHTQEKVSEALGKSRSHIANLLRLLNLPPKVQDFVREGQLSAGHARTLVTADDPEALARTIISKGLSVRAAEKLAKEQKPGSEQPRRPATASEKDADTRALEADLSAATGLKISIDHKPGGTAGTMTIRYKHLEQLDDLCARLSKF
jgi:ParB family chromosome partitioning protein